MAETTDSRGEFVKAGYLIKSPPVSRALVAQWHRRWFLLMDSKLVYPLAERYVRLDYYQSEADAKRLADPKGSINLNSCLSIVSRNEPIKNFRHAFDVCTTERVYHLAADTEEEKISWVTTLKELLFPSSENGPNLELQQRSSSKTPEITRRTQAKSKPQRPLSFTGSSNQSRNKVSSRPLPPVPDTVAATNNDRKNRPLPAPPTESSPPSSALSPSEGIRIHPIGPQVSPLSQKKRIKLPPPKPAPYKVSQPSRPELSYEEKILQDSSSFSCSSTSDPSVEDYQEFVSQLSFQPDHYEFGPGLVSTEDNYSLATSVPQGCQKHSHNSKDNSSMDTDYSVLEASVVQGYDPKDQDYSHLEPDVGDSPPPPIRQSSLAQHHVSDTSLLKPQPKARTKLNQRPRSAVPDYVNYPSSSSTKDDYSRLHH